MRVRFLRPSSESPLKPSVWSAEVQISSDPEVRGAFLLQDFHVLGESSLIEEDAVFMHQGLMDSHLHLSWIGEQERRIVGDRFSNAQNFVEALQQELNQDSYAHGEILLSYAFDEERWGLSLKEFEQLLLSHLDPERRWVVYRICGHSAFVSPSFLKEFSVSSSGNRLDDRGIHDLQKMLPKVPQEQVRKDILRAQSLLLQSGINAVGDMSLDRSILESVQGLHKEFLLELDYQGVYLDGSFNDFQLSGPLREESSKKNFHFEIVHWKRYLDGSFGSRTAHLRNPYSDKFSETGLCLYDTKELIESSRKALSQGFALSFHAIGDAALEQILILSEALAQPMDAMNRQQGRCVHRIEHAQLVGKDQLQRLKKLGLWILCVQPYHRVADAVFSEKRLGGDRLVAQAYRLASFLRAGLPVSLGSDAPITSFDPRKTLFGAMTHPNPEEWISFEQALWHMSVLSRRVHGLPVRDWTLGQRVWLLEPRTICPA